MAVKMLHYGTTGGALQGALAAQKPLPGSIHETPLARLEQYVSRRQTKLERVQADVTSLDARRNALVEQKTEAESTVAYALSEEKRLTTSIQDITGRQEAALADLASKQKLFEDARADLTKKHMQQNDRSYREVRSTKVNAEMGYKHAVAAAEEIQAELDVAISSLLSASTRREEAEAEAAKIIAYVGTEANPAVKGHTGRGELGKISIALNGPPKGGLLGLVAFRQKRLQGAQSALATAQANPEQAEAIYEQLIANHAPRDNTSGNGAAHAQG